LDKHPTLTKWRREVNPSSSLGDPTKNKKKMLQFRCAICEKEITGVAIVLDEEHIVHHYCRNEVEIKNNWSDEELLKDIIEQEKEEHSELFYKL
jgi:hypothetical protein